jgi:hypothetical protein
VYKEKVRSILFKVDTSEYLLEWEVIRQVGVIGCLC